MWLYQVQGIQGKAQVKIESILYDNCGKDLKQPGIIYMAIGTGLKANNSMAYWIQPIPKYAGSVDVCNIECFIELVKKEKQNDPKKAN